MDIQIKINALQTAIAILLQDHPEFFEEGSTGGDLIANLDTMRHELVEEAYPIQDFYWPSRKWNSEMTDFVDLSGLSNIQLSEL